jgi:hypothetical protein
MSFTIDNLNLVGIEKESKLYKLIEKLNLRNNYGEKAPVNSIMHFEQLCEHDNGFLCEHRLQYIIDYIKNNFNERQ